MAILTDAYLRGLKPRDKPYKQADEGERGEGSLIAEVLPKGGIDFWYRFHIRQKETQIKIGRFDTTGKNGVTLKAARRQLRKFRKIRREHGDVKQHLAEIERQKQAQKDAEARRGSLGDLCNGYVASLKTAGKVSARNVELSLRLHVEKAYPRIWRSPAASVTADEIRDVLATMVESGCTRQVNIVRSYLSAAFAWGAKADRDPRSVAAKGKRYGLQANPVALIPRIGEWERTGERALSDDELAAYWHELATLSAAQRDCLRFLLAEGGQRASQVLRAPWSAYDFEANVLHLRDPKGRGPVRDHLLPLTDFALEQLTTMRQANSDAPGPFSSDGRTIVNLETLSKAVTAISERLTQEHEVPTFRFGDLRRTCETTLARLGVSKDVRAWLLSHGRASDVQSKHYDMYSYLPEKKAALEVWAAHLAAIQKPKAERGAKVMPMSRRRKA